MKLKIIALIFLIVVVSASNWYYKRWGENYPVSWKVGNFAVTVMGSGIILMLLAQICAWSCI